MIMHTWAGHDCHIFKIKVQNDPDPGRMIKARPALSIYTAKITPVHAHGPTVPYQLLPQQEDECSRRNHQMMQEPAPYIQSVYVCIRDRIHCNII